MFGLEPWQLAALAGGALLVGWPYLAPLAARLKPAPAPAPEPVGPRKEDPEVFYFRMYRALRKRAEERQAAEAVRHLDACVEPLFGPTPQPDEIPEPSPP